MKKKFLIVFLICCMFFGVASPALAVDAFDVTPFPGYDSSFTVGDFANRTYSYPCLVSTKSDLYYGVGFQLIYGNTGESVDLPSNIYMETDSNQNFTFYVPVEISDLEQVLGVYYTGTFVDGQGNLSINKAGSYPSFNTITVNNIDYYQFTLSIQYQDVPQLQVPLIQFNPYYGSSAVYNWDNGPTMQMVGELPPQMMNLGITQVEVPVGQQVVGNLRILLPFGIGLLALLMALLLLSKVLRKYLR